MTAAGKAWKLSLLAAAGTAPSAALAEAQSTNMGVTANVTANCTISATPVAFNNVNTLAGNHDSTGTVTVNCSNGAAWSVSAGAGNGSGATVASRRMTILSGTSTLNYSLYTTASYATVWGNGTSGTAAIAGTGTGNAQVLTIYGRIPSGQNNAPVGAYADTVSVTVTY